MSNQAVYGCHNSIRSHSYSVLDGVIDHLRLNDLVNVSNGDGCLVPVRVFKIKEIPDLMSKDCKYDLSSKDVKCGGCRKAKGDLRD